MSNKKRHASEEAEKQGERVTRQRQAESAWTTRRGAVQLELRPGGRRNARRV